MSRIITRKRTKSLVRSLPKKLSDEEYNVAFHQRLYYSDTGEFAWINRMWNREDVVGARELPLNMQELYEEESLGVYKKRKLGVLDEYVYRKLNAVKVSKKEEVKGKSSVKEKQTLNFIQIITEEVEGNNLVRVKSKKDRPQSRREEFQGLSGKDMGYGFEQYLGMRYNGDLKVVHNSNKDEMNVVISNIEEGKERLVVNLVRSFDRYL